MRILLLAIFVLGCGQVDSGGSGGGDDGGGGGGGGGGGSGAFADCITDTSQVCVCPGDNSCRHACSSGAAECHVLARDRPIEVTCAENLECHIDCLASSSCKVECGGSADCHVSCPATGCTVTGCVGSECAVSCGQLAPATHNGTTATCP